MPGSDKSYDDRYSRVWGFSDRTGGSESLGKWITFFDSLWKVKGVLFREGGCTGLRARRERYVLQCRGPQIFQWKTSLRVTGVSPWGTSSGREGKEGKLREASPPGIGLGGLPSNTWWGNPLSTYQEPHCQKRSLLGIISSWLEECVFNYVTGKKIYTIK